MTMTTRNMRRRGLLAVGAGLTALAAGPLSVGTAAAQQQQCEQLAARAEQEMQAAELTDTQREYIVDLIGTARTFAGRGDEPACMDNLADLAEYVDQERIDLPVAAEIEEDRASAVGDTQEAGSGAQGDRPQQQQGTVAPSDASAAGQMQPGVTVERSSAEPNVSVERAEPEITVEQAQPNVIIEQADPTVTIERVPAAGGGTGTATGTGTGG